MDELLYMVLRGLAIGVVVSAPMGPVGILCIQRTLDKGRRSGFFTGIGAAISDLLYCLLTGFCLSFIEDFIQRNRMPIQLIGSAVLIFFGIYLLRKNPVDSLRQRADMDSPSPGGDILRGFLFTFSNPLILFLIIGLFAQFNFVIEGIKFYHYILGFIGIAAGAVGWWWLVTYFVNKLRAHFNVRSMWLINRIIGVIILIFAAFGIYSSVSAASAPAPPYSFRVSDPSKSGWHADVTDGTAGFRISVAHVATTDAFGDRDADRMAVRVTEIPSGREIATSVVYKGLDCRGGWNAWRLTRSGNEWILFGGNREYGRLLSFSRDMSATTSPILSAAEGGDKVKFTGVSEGIPAERTEKSNVQNPDSLIAACSRIQSRPGVEGIYSLLDYSHDESYASLGGNYRIAVLRDDSALNIHYLSGAVKLASMWHPGMKKGSLAETPFSNIFDVEWVDAEGAAMTNDLRGEYDPLTATLTIQFPYQNSSLRFRKE